LPNVYIALIGQSEKKKSIYPEVGHIFLIHKAWTTSFLFSDLRMRLVSTTKASKVADSVVLKKTKSSFASFVVLAPPSTSPGVEWWETGVVMSSGTLLKVHVDCQVRHHVLQA
jgi:hypothetical protein